MTDSLRDHEAQMSTNSDPGVCIPCFIYSGSLKERTWVTSVSDRETSAVKKTKGRLHHADAFSEYVRESLTETGCSPEDLNADGLPFPKGVVVGLALLKVTSAVSAHRQDVLQCKSSIQTELRRYFCEILFPEACSCDHLLWLRIFRFCAMGLDHLPIVRPAIETFGADGVPRRYVFDLTSASAEACLRCPEEDRP